MKINQFISRHLSRRGTQLALLLLFISIVLIGVDVTMGILEDKGDVGAVLFDLGIEFAIIFSSLGAFLIMIQKYKEERLASRVLSERSVQLMEEIETREVELSGLRDDFTEYMKNQFLKWELTKSEREIAYLLILGLRVKKIAESRFVADKTIMNHTKSIYDKASVAGRHELAAYFVKNLMQS